jgi:predicted NUDIX family NTP pyrophosphohydrolase
MMDFPEVDRAKWMDYMEAAKMINPAQILFLDRAREIYNK